MSPTRLRFIQISLALVILTCCCFCFGQNKPKSCPVPEPIKDAKFHPGQVWQYKTRPNEENSRLTILRVESLPPAGTVIHIRVNDVRLRNCAGGPEPETIAHMPFSKDAIERSVTKLLREGSTEKLDLGGYEQWRADCGGVYTITVAEAIMADEYTFNKGLGCTLPEEQPKKKTVP